MKNEILRTESISPAEKLDSLLQSTHSLLSRHVQVDRAALKLGSVTERETDSAAKALQHFQAALVICEETNESPWDHHNFLRVSLQQMGMHCPDDFLSTFEHDDLIEGYDLNNIQIFRNLKYMQVCGYSLEDVLTHSWPELYERSSRITDELLGNIRGVFESGQTTALKISTHYMKERISKNRQVSEVTFRYMAPIFSRPGVPVGVLVSSRARIVDEAPLRHELRFL